MTGKTRAEELREKAARLQRQQAAAHDQTAAGTHPGHDQAAAEPVLAKPVRSTLDLPPAVHRDLQRWLGESAVRLGKARLTKQDVLEALVKRLLVDETLTKLILADLKEGQ
ncbi:hypothetical protein ACQP2F_46440 (plasmid) [Actinoplanes sp. CA-030573]|uniref:hypothetical protein n=1 Tax=Actinoplanes sp. CA-030573 TaxID=3239898 RepID=UPI003D908610